MPDPFFLLVLAFPLLFSAFGFSSRFGDGDGEGEGEGSIVGDGLAAMLLFVADASS